jgi:PhnB protein
VAEQGHARQSGGRRPGLHGRRRCASRYEKPKGFSLSLHINSTTEAERIFHLLAKDGTVVMPLEKTFWAARFGMLIDRFGMPWVINGGEPDQPGEA